ncbi:S8 family serine peptidase [Oceanobacillus sp. CAU 1775]
MTFSLFAPTAALAQPNGNVSYSLNDSKQIVEQKVSNRLLSNFKNDDFVTFLVKFNDKADVQKAANEAVAKANSLNQSNQSIEHIRRSAVIAELKETSFNSQQNVKAYIEKEIANGNAKDIRSYHIVNGMAVTATREVAEKIATFTEVEKLLPNEMRELYTTVTEDAKRPEAEIANVEWNVERVGAPSVWEMGIDGSGVVVASIDTGVQWDHPGLKEKYRGYDAATGEVDHTYSWYDATGSAQVPFDDQGHGTHVTGTMVGSEPDGSNQVGVAPGAKYLSVRAFTAAGGSDADLLDAAEWILAPGGDATMAPDVVNNSWGGGPGLDEWYRDVVINWRTADIFPEFSAGNTTLFNPGGPGSIATPANYPESFATGATDINDALASFSLQGPSPYEGDVKPDISAPGVNIRSTVPGSGYEGGWNGTSMAGPAVSAVVALMLQADSSLTIDEIEDIIMMTASPLTDSTFPNAPNMGYGYGLVNAYDAVSSLISGLGSLQGTVTEDGEDFDAPTYTHEAVDTTFEGMDLELSIHAEDNVSVVSVEVVYSDKTIEADLVDGDYRSGEYTVTIPGEDIEGDAFTYHFVINDFGGNEVTTDSYTIDVQPGITVGYFQDFEGTPAGWTIFGTNSSWERGIPTSGPGSAVSGENVYATNLNGDYNSSENSTLLMPPIDLPEGESYLQYSEWFNLENNWDFGHVYLSTDMENWTQLVQITNLSNGWLDSEIDLSAYSGERVYIGFNITSDSIINRSGWYIDDVGLSDTSLEATSNRISPVIGGPSIGLHGTGLSLGVMNSDSLRGDANRERIDPTKLTPALPVKKTPIKTEDLAPQALPLGATVTVLESGRSVNTNPADGSYSFLHAAGEFTVAAHAYGYHQSEQAVEITADESTTANFLLEELEEYTVSGTITNEVTGEPVSEATLLLVEDANITPVSTDENGNYSITAYEGVYTVKVMASGYHGKEIEADFTVDGTLDIELEPFYTVPGGEIGYDDGTAENARAFYDPGNGWAVKMSLEEGREAAVVTDGVFQFHDSDWPVPGGTGFAVEVWDANGPNGTPGERIAGPVQAEATRSLAEWTVVDLSEYGIVVEGDFYMVYIQTSANTSAPGLATDEDGPNAERSYQYVSGAWTPSPAAEGNYMIRARVSYEVDEPIITSPESGLITNETEITVEGKASPETTVKLVNNGEKVSTVEVAGDGSFAIPTELEEGNNELVAITILDGVEVMESEVVSVILDTEAPELSIDSPRNGDKSNRETVTVEGTVADAHLDFVEVNGQRAQVTDGFYSKRILLDEGQNSIEVVATDLAGNMATESVTLNVKFTAPEIENITPEEDVYLNAGQSVKFEFDSEPGLKATFFIHMPLTNMTTNATELPMMETEEGHYVGYWTAISNVSAKGAVIEVKVVDAYGNEARKQADGKLFINIE